MICTIVTGIPHTLDLIVCPLRKWGQETVPIGLFCLAGIRWVLTNPNWVIKHVLIPA